MKLRYASVAVTSAVLFNALPIAGTVHAQELGPQRQFIAIEPMYAYLGRELGSTATGGTQRLAMSGYGARLWINLAPFSGPSRNLIGKTGLGLFSTYFPTRDGVSVVHYGADLDIHVTNNPYREVLDPFFSLGGGVIRTKIVSANTVGLAPDKVNKFALTPGVGMRVFLGNRIQLRGDLRDALIFSDAAGMAPLVALGGGNSGSSASSRTTNNIEGQISLGLTF